MFVRLRQRATSSSTSGWPSFKLTACTRGTRQLKSTAASWRRCATAPRVVSLTKTETWWLSREKWKQLISTELQVNSVFLLQSSAGLTDLTVAPGVPPSANTAVNKKVSAWLQQSHQPDACVQGKDGVSTKHWRGSEFKSRWNKCFHKSFWIVLIMHVSDPSLNISFLVSSTIKKKDLTWIKYEHGGRTWCRVSFQSWTAVIWTSLS